MFRATGLHKAYLRKSREADKQMERTTNPEARQAWDRIAVGYLELAELVRQRNRHSFARLLSVGLRQLSILPLRNGG